MIWGLAFACLLSVPRREIPRLPPLVATAQLAPDGSARIRKVSTRYVGPLGLGQVLVVEPDGTGLVFNALSESTADGWTPVTPLSVVYDSSVLRPMIESLADLGQDARGFGSTSTRPSLEVTFKHAEGRYRFLVDYTVEGIVKRRVDVAEFRWNAVWGSEALSSGARVTIELPGPAPELFRVYTPGQIDWGTTWAFWRPRLCAVRVDPASGVAVIERDSKTGPGLIEVHALISPSAFPRAEDQPGRGRAELVAYEEGRLKAENRIPTPGQYFLRISLSVLALAMVLVFWRLGWLRRRGAGRSDHTRRTDN